MFNASFTKYVQSENVGVIYCDNLLEIYFYCFFSCLILYSIIHVPPHK